MKSLSSEDLAEWTRNVNLNHFAHAKQSQQNLLKISLAASDIILLPPVLYQTPFFKTKQ